MLRFKLILLPSVLVLALPGWAEAGPEKASVSQTRPLNLSLPRDVLIPGSGSGQSDQAAQRNLDAPDQGRSGADASPRPGSLPYGSGYEHRHQDVQGAGGVTGAGAGAGNGTGRRGR